MKISNLFQLLRRWTPLLVIISLLIGGALFLSKYFGESKQGVDVKLIAPQVQVQWFDAASEPLFVVMRGHTEANSMVVIKARTNGTVIKVHQRQSEVVKKDTPLVELSVDDRRTQLQAAEARLKDQEIQYEAKQKLAQQNFQSKISMYDAFAALQRARNDLERAQLTLSFTNIRAPFSGVVNDILVEEGDLINEGASIAELLNLDPLEIVGAVSETDYHKVSLNAPVKIRLFDGRTCEGLVTYVAKHADPKTRTFKVKVSVPNPNYAIVSGLTAEAEITVGSDHVHTIPASALGLSDEGTIGVKVVDDQNVAHFIPVTIVSGATHTLKVRGLPDRTCLIIVGQEFVVDGQLVSPVEPTQSPSPVHPSKVAS
jgi:multidrug efflux system membrane fusion protein